MLKQRRSSRQPRTDAGSEGDGEVDAPPASTDTFPLYRNYQSGLDSYYDTAKQVLEDDLDEKLTLKGEPRQGINRSEKEQRISPQVQSYHRVRGPRIQSGTYNRNGEDDYYEIDHFGCPFNRTDNPTRTPSPLRYYSPHSSVQHRAADIFEGRSTVGREKADLDYDVDTVTVVASIPGLQLRVLEDFVLYSLFFVVALHLQNTRNLGPSNLPYKPSQAPPPYGGYSSYSRSYGNPIEAAQRPRDIAMLRGDGKPLQRLSLADYTRGRRRAKAQKATENLAHEQAERLWKAEYREGPGVRLRAMRSFSKLYDKDTISRDSTIGNEARMDDLLACVGKKMMKTPSLKEPRGEGLSDGEKLGGHTRNEYQEVEDRYQSRSKRIESTSDTAAWQQFSPSPSPSTESGESEVEYEEVAPAPLPRPTWADADPRRPLTRATHVHA